MTPDPGRTRVRQIGGTHGGNTQPGKPENETKQRKPAQNATRETNWGRRRWQGQGAGSTQQAPAQKKTEPKRRNGQIALICQTKKAPAQKRRASIQDAEPRPQRETETTQRETGYNPPKEETGDHLKNQVTTKKKTPGGRDMQPRRRDGHLTENAG